MEIYACADLHGRLDLYQKIKQYIQPDDEVYFLGDASDRGPDGWELIKHIYNDKQFIYIKGNHEDMLVEAAKIYLQDATIDSAEYKLLKRNCGHKTFEDWLSDDDHGNWIAKLDALPLHVEYVNNNNQTILMSHAGYTPIAISNLNNKIILPDEEELLWDRHHFYDIWNEHMFPSHIVVHGHTPSVNLARYFYDTTSIAHPYWYANNHKVSIDIFAVYSNKTCLLNLNTLEHVIIE